MQPPSHLGVGEGGKRGNKGDSDRDPLRFSQAAVLNHAIGIAPRGRVRQHNRNTGRRPNEGGIPWNRAEEEELGATFKGRRRQGAGEGSLSNQTPDMTPIGRREPGPLKLKVDPPVLFLWHTMAPSF